MNKAVILAGLVLFGGVVGVWRYNSYQASIPTSERKMPTVTLDYPQGTLGGMLKELEGQAGLRYEVTADAGSIPFSGSFKDKSLAQVHRAVAKQSKVDLRPDPTRQGTVLVTRK